MPDALPIAPILGQVAYLAYWRVLAPLHLPWARLSQAERRAWQAAARAAVRAAKDTGSAKRRQECPKDAPHA